MRKVPRGRVPPTAAPHPDPRKRRTTVGQEYGKVDRHGEYHPPRGGMLPERVSKEAPWPEREARRQEAESRRFAKPRG